MIRAFLCLLLLSITCFGQGTTPTFQVKTINDLISTPIPNVNNRLTAIVTGRSNTNDGGGGVFFFTPSTTVGTNLGTVFSSTGISGFWVRQYSGELNVMWFGAIGDGINDDTPAFTNAIAMAFATNGTVFVPPGRFSINPITMPETNVVLHGVTSQYHQDSLISSNRSVLVARSAGVLLTIPSSGNLVGAKVYDLVVDGNNLATTGISANGTFVLSDVAVANCTGQGILSKSLNSAIFERVSSTRNAIGIVVTNGASPVSTKFSMNSCTFSSNTGKGAVFRSGRNVTIRDTIFQSNGDNGVYIWKPSIELTGCDSFRFQTCWFEENGANTLNATNSYQILIDAQDSAITRPTRLTMDNCLFSASVNRGCLNAISLLQSRFEHCFFSSTQNTQTMGVNANECVFFNCLGASGLTGRNFQQVFDSSITGGGFSLEATLIANTLGVGTQTPSSGLTLHGSSVNFIPEVRFEETANGAITWRLGSLGIVADAFNLRSPSTGLNYWTALSGNGRMIIGNSATDLGSGILQVYGGLTFNGAQTIQTSSGTLTVQGNGGATTFGGDIQATKTITAAGTTGNQTINKTMGSVNIIAGGTSIVVNNTLVTVNSVVFATVATNDATATLKNAVAGAGTITITITAAATAETRINFIVFN